MRNKDEFSMTKIGLKTSNSQQNLLAFNDSKSNFNYTIIKSKESAFKSLPKLKYGRMNLKSKNFNNSNSSTFINYVDKKKLSFYKGSNISLSSFFLDGNKTISTDMRDNSGSFIKPSFKHSKIFPYFRKRVIESNDNNNEKQVIKKSKDKIISTLNPYLDISKLTYKTTITSIRNKYSILFNKEFELFDKFVPSLYTLKFDHETKFYLNQLHNKILSCTKYLSGVFLDQDIETFKINESILEKILTNLLQLFILNNKVNNGLIKHTKKIMIDSNRDKQDKKKIVEDDINTQIKKLKKKIENRNEKIKQIKAEKFQEDNNYMISIKKLRDEQNDLVKLLQKNLGYFNKFKDCQIEIKKKNNIITQQKIDYNDMLDKHFFDKVKLEEEVEEIKEYIKPIQEENELVKEKNKELKEKIELFDEIMQKKNQIIHRLQENLMMKDEELNSYLNEIYKVKEQNDKLSYNLIQLKNKYQTLSNKKYGFNEFGFNNKIKDD